MPSLLASSLAMATPSGVLTCPHCHKTNPTRRAEAAAELLHAFMRREGRHGATWSRVPRKAQWNLSHLVHYSTRLVVERLTLLGPLCALNEL